MEVRPSAPRVRARVMGPRTSDLPPRRRTSPHPLAVVVGAGRDELEVVGHAHERFPRLGEDDDRTARKMASTCRRPRPSSARSTRLRKALGFANRKPYEASRIDVSEGTRTLHRSAAARYGRDRKPACRRGDDGRRASRDTRREGLQAATVKKSIRYLRAVLDECGLPENAAGASRRPSPRPAALAVSVPPVLFAAVTALVPREDGVPERPVFQGFGADKFRTAITRACTAGVPTFSPHSLRHRRISLEHLRACPGPASARPSASAR